MGEVVGYESAAVRLLLAELVCELQQRGTKSRSWTAGRFSNQEPSVHAFDLMLVDRYADDGIDSKRTVRLRYDVPPPKDGDLTAGDVPAVRLPTAASTNGSRASSRSRATTSR